MMTDEERKKVFWLLKKATSYTTWKALADAWSEFVNAWEYAVKHADHSKRDLSEGITQDYKRFLDGKIAFEKGLSRLRWGNKNVFRATSVGYLKATLAPMAYAERILDPEEFVFNWAKNKEEIFQAFELVMKQENYIIGIFEQALSKAPAPWRADDALTFVDRGYIPPDLSDLPPPTDIVTFTGREVPFDGIWEPEWRTLLEVSRSMVGLPSGIEKGCMNYLVAGTTAPYYHDFVNQTPYKVSWRLIWEDTRYKDGIIPDEETEYLL